MMIRSAIALAFVLAASAPHELNAQGPREAIAVRGHWVFEVRRQDGTVVERRELDNALTGGGQTLAGLLVGRAMGQWQIHLTATGATASPFLDRAGTRQLSTTMVEPQGSIPLEATGFRTLTLSREGASLVLTGMATASADGFLGRVDTFATTCAQGTAVADCAAMEPSVPANTIQTPFSGTDITPLELKDKQILQITVKISFSSRH